MHWPPENDNFPSIPIPAETEHFGHLIAILRLCADGGHDQAGICSLSSGVKASIDGRLIHVISFEFESRLRPVFFFFAQARLA
jgi:hypothetical protein